MWEYVLASLWFFAPAGLANMTPILVAHLPGLSKWNTPIDGGRTYRGKPLLGPNKTVRGLVFGVLVAYLFLLWQRYAVENGMWASDLQWLDYSTLNVEVAALAFGLGALGGDAVESFFKRQANIPSGEAWIPFDQIDYILGGLFLISLVADVSASEILITLAVWGLIHPFATITGWILGLKEKPI